MSNKKVLLRERKRHTARRVASTPYVVLTGYPPRAPPPARVPPSPQPGNPPQPGYPPSQGTPPARVPPSQGTPQLDLAGYPPPAAPWHSGKCCKALWNTGTPPPGVDRQTKWNYYLPIVLRTRAVMNELMKTRELSKHNIMRNIFVILNHYKKYNKILSWQWVCGFKTKFFFRFNGFFF